MDLVQSPGLQLGMLCAKESPQNAKKTLVFGGGGKSSLSFLLQTSFCRKWTAFWISHVTSFRMCLLFPIVQRARRRRRHIWAYRSCCPSAHENLKLGTGSSHQLFPTIETPFASAIR
jgi:hypothetical protein